MAFLYAPGNLRKPRKTILAVFYGSLLRINQKLTIASSLAALKKHFDALHGYSYQK